MKCPDCDNGKVTLLISIVECKRCGGTGHAPDIEPIIWPDAEKRAADEVPDKIKIDFGQFAIPKSILDSLVYRSYAEANVVSRAGRPPFDFTKSITPHPAHRITYVSPRNDEIGRAALRLSGQCKDTAKAFHVCDDVLLVKIEVGILPSGELVRIDEIDCASDWIRITDHSPHVFQSILLRSGIYFHLDDLRYFKTFILLAKKLMNEKGIAAVTAGPSRSSIAGFVR